MQLLLELCSGRGEGRVVSDGVVRAMGGECWCGCAAVLRLRKEPNLPGVKPKNLPGVYRAIYRELPGVTGSYRELPHLPGATRMPIYRELTGSLPGVPGAVFGNAF